MGSFQFPLDLRYIQRRAILRKRWLSGQVKRMSPPEAHAFSLREYMLRLEHNLMVGNGRWVADFNESFWDYRLGRAKFHMLLTGGMRAKGFALSRLVSRLVMPDYRVACFVSAGDAELKGLPALLQEVDKFMAEQDIEWAWLVIPREDSFSRRAKAMVERNDRRELGIALVDLAAQEITNSSSYVGRRMPRFIRCFR